MVDSLSFARMPLRPRVRCAGLARCGGGLAVALILSVPVVSAAPRLHLALEAPFTSSAERDVAEPVFEFGSSSQRIDESGIPGAEPGTFDDSLSANLSRADDTIGGHIIRWHYDSRWSSSLGSDFPRFGASDYLIGRGGAGVNQKVWLMFSISRHF